MMLRFQSNARVALLPVMAAPLLLMCNASMRAEVVAEYKQITAKIVFDHLVAAINDPITPPRLMVVHDTSLTVASLYPPEGIIRLEERFYDLCTSFGEDSLNALASVIGHELAHYYGRYGLANKPGRFNNGQDFRHITLASTAHTSEARADGYAGFYGLQAGYDVPRVMPEIISKIYTAYNFPDNLPRYVSRAERQKIAMDVKAKLLTLIPVFDTGIYLALVRRYAEAVRCYDRVIADFPSRELLNNVGVIYMLYALDLEDDKELNFVYPLELDADTRLGGIKISDGARQLGSRNPDGADIALIGTLLDSAEKRFLTARAMDGTYTPALINLATVYILRHDYPRAIELANKAMQLDTNGREHILAITVRSIAEARSLRFADARTGLHSVRESAVKEGLENIIAANLAVLEGTPFSIESKRDNGVFENIHELLPKDTVISSPADLRESIGGPSKLMVVYKVGDDYNILRAERINSQKERRNGEKEKSWIQFIYTRGNFTKGTAKGVHLGSTLRDVQVEYGDIPRSVNTRGGKFYIYEYSKIIFLVGDDGRVKSWAIYAME